jgi:hypothetical protein
MPACFARACAVEAIRAGPVLIWRGAGGCDFLRDPDVPAAQEPALWLPEIAPNTLILTPAPSGFEINATFDPAALGTVLADRVDGSDRHIVVGDASGDLHVWLQEVVAAERPAVILPLDDACELRIDIASRLYRRLRGKRTSLLPRALQLTPMQRTRLILLLHAFDFHDAGGGPRDIAAALIDTKEASLPAIEWKGSAARRKANRLIRDAITLVNGGYLKLLRGD